MSHRIILIAINKDPWLINYIPSDQMTQEYANIAVNKDIDIYSNIPDQFKTNEIRKQYASYVKIRSRQGP